MGFVELIQEKIMLIDNTVMGTISGDVPRLIDAMKHYPSAGGKRLRPVMALAACGAIGGEVKKALPYALSLELTHNFTLVHDDLMDKDNIRRGKPSVHILYDDATAINAGDALFARAIYVLTNLEIPAGDFKEILSDYAIMVQGIAEGQQMDMDFENRETVTEDEYLLMVEKKTALMFQYAAKGGGLIGGGSRDKIEALDEYGRLLGIGFQIWDDLLDLMSDEETLGKPVGSDIKNGKKTLAAVWALNNLEGKNRDTFLTAFDNLDANNEQVQNAVEAMKNGGAIDYARNFAEDYAEKSRKLLDIIPDNDNKNILLAAVEYMVRREK